MSLRGIDWSDTNWPFFWTTIGVIASGCLCIWLGSAGVTPAVISTALCILCGRWAAKHDVGLLIVIPFVVILTPIMVFFIQFLFFCPGCAL